MRSLKQPLPLWRRFRLVLNNGEALYLALATSRCTVFVLRGTPKFRKVEFAPPLISRAAEAERELLPL